MSVSRHLDLYNQIVTVGDFVKLLDDPEFDWTRCMLDLCSYKEGDVAYKKIGEVLGNWSIDLSTCELLAKAEDLSNKYVLGSELETLQKYNYDYGYDQLDANEVCHAIAEQLGFINYKACINLQYPGSMASLHADSLSGWLKDASVDLDAKFDKALKQPSGSKKLHRCFVALSDWQRGWMWQFGNEYWSNWKKGDVVWFDWRNIPHATANAGYAPRPILKISGQSDIIDDIIQNNRKLSINIGRTGKA